MLLDIGMIQDLNSGFVFWSKWKIYYFKHVNLSGSSHLIVPCTTSIYHCRDGIYFAVKEASLSENNIKVQKCVSQLEQVREIAYTFVFFLCHHTSRKLWINFSYRCFIYFSIFFLEPFLRIQSNARFLLTIPNVLTWNVKRWIDELKPCPLLYILSYIFNVPYCIFSWKS